MTIHLFNNYSIIFNKNKWNLLYLFEKHNLEFSCIACKGVLLYRHLWWTELFFLRFRFGSLGTSARLSAVLNSRNLSSTSFSIVSHSFLQLVRNFSKSENANGKLCITSPQAFKDPTRCLFGLNKTQGKLPISSFLNYYFFCEMQHHKSSLYLYNQLNASQVRKKIFLVYHTII